MQWKYWKRNAEKVGRGRPRKDEKRFESARFYRDEWRHKKTLRTVTQMGLRSNLTRKKEWCVMTDIMDS